MIIEDGKFYFIKDEFFDIFKGYKLMSNKETGTKRPCYFCFRDRRNKEIIWFVPKVVKDDIITIALRVVRLVEEGVNIPFYNIIEMKEILLKEQN